MEPDPIITFCSDIRLLRSGRSWLGAARSNPSLKIDRGRAKTVHVGCKHLTLHNERVEGRPPQCKSVQTGISSWRWLTERKWLLESGGLISRHQITRAKTLENKAQLQVESRDRKPAAREGSITRCSFVPVCEKVFVQVCVDVFLSARLRKSIHGS